MQNFTYHAPASLAEALALKIEDDAGTRFLAGGTDLFLAMEFAGEPVKTVVDLKKIPELTGIEELPGGGYRLGALTLMGQIEAHQGLRAQYPALVDAATVVGGPPIRNRATLGGNICNASPAADASTPLLALGAELVAVSAEGERSLPLGDFWSGPRQNALKPGELLKEVRLPALPEGGACAFERLTRSAMDIAVVNAAAAVSLDDAGNFASAQAALGAVGPVVLTVDGLGDALRGQPCSPEILEQVRKLAEAAAQPIDDKRASAEYRRDMAGVLAMRAVERAQLLARQGKGDEK
ncbi:MAG: xanthine dehydrogenase family protein subunit M [SAR324 cluster bacterium]|nr:xanthine dehydrogenase family protein subunit M [SAR324 cluster bacterium]